MYRIYPLLLADISAFVGRYLCSCWQISSPVAFHIPIHSANGYAMNFLMNTPRDKLKIHAGRMGIKTLFRIFTPENKAAVAAVFIFFWITN